MSTALVTGGSQGVGKGIVEGLSEIGLQVYFTSRDTARLQRAAAAAATLGGELFPRRVDHHDASQVEALFTEIGAKIHRLCIPVPPVRRAGKHTHLLLF
jgi:NAD(P)-dependent dehydrogenase (short-subunit alcohol dehydrogenase family)